MTHGDYRKRDLLILIFLTTVLFGYKLGDRALWSPVEGHYAEIAREMVAASDYLTPRLAGMKYLEKPPLFYWLEIANIKVFGLNEWSLRLWPAVFASIGCLAVYVAGAGLFGRRVGLLASAVLGTSSLWYVMGHVIDLDMTASALITCALFSFLLGSVHESVYKRRFAMWGFFVFSALATLTKGLIGIVIPAMVIGTWILILGDWNILTMACFPSGLFLFLLIAAPWYLLIAHANPGFLRSYLIDEHFRRYLTKPKGPFEQPWAYVPVLLAGVFPWTVFALQAIKHNLRFSWWERRRHKEVLFLVLWAGLVFLFFSASSYKGVPYILPMFPPLAILIGRYITAAWDSLPVSGVRAGAFVLMGVLLLAGAALARPQHYLERYSNWPALEAPAEGTVASVKAFGDLSALRPYIRAQRAVLIAGFLSAIGLLFTGKLAVRGSLVSLTLCWAVFLLILNSSLPALDDRRSVKALVSALKPRLQYADEVASYHAYYQDLPVYLDRPVAVVGWRGNLQFGVEVNEHSGGWMMDDASFWRRWNGPATVYMVTEKTTYEKLRSSSFFKHRLVTRSLYDVLLVNKTAPEITAHPSIREYDRVAQTGRMR